MGNHQTMNSELISKTLTWHCEKCGKHESMTVELPDIIAGCKIPPPRLCNQCNRAEITERNRQSRLDQMETLADQSGIPLSFRHFDQNRGNDHLRKRCIDNIGGSMWICGPRGIGKTVGVCQAAMAEIESGTALIKFVRLADIATSLTDKERGIYVLRGLLAARVLILDDFAVAHVSAALGLRIFSLIDTVYNSQNQRRIWITCDLPADAIAARFEDASCAARIIGRFKRMVSDGRMAVISANNGAGRVGTHEKR
ncbi:MAG: ATP-binding protein [Victivallaceae bacterium]